MARNFVRQVPMPPDSMISGIFGGADLADAFAITLPQDGPHEIESIARAVLGNPSPWFRALLACRDALVAPFGVKPSGQLRRELQASSSAHIDFFPVVSLDVNELVIGADDTHLDFRTSVLLRSAALEGQYEVVVSSVVHCRNRFGHLYLFVIAPFHRSVVRSNLARAEKAWRDK
jgi:hypothetical protein